MVSYKCCHLFGIFLTWMWSSLLNNDMLVIRGKIPLLFHFWIQNMWVILEQGRQNWGRWSFWCRQFSGFQIWRIFTRMEMYGIEHTRNYYSIRLGINICWVSLEVKIEIQICPGRHYTITWHWQNHLTVPEMHLFLSC